MDITCETYNGWNIRSRESRKLTGAKSAVSWASKDPLGADAPLQELALDLYFEFGETPAEAVTKLKVQLDAEDSLHSVTNNSHLTTATG